MSDLHNAIEMANKALDERDLWKSRFEELAKKQIEERKEWVAVGEEGGRQLEREDILREIESRYGDLVETNYPVNETIKLIQARGQKTFCLDCDAETQKFRCGIHNVFWFECNCSGPKKRPGCLACAQEEQNA